ncbi:hypothetical protein OSB04_003558 [Centaurea solstitialis]|uniref:Uncharacterized protein n=1 Tax=Centaurea solstitialis TaxID=347529 RepID=A0AA38WNX3_9ASTR|nr:hypothetical protein OSB04_003558 [Centaurea solstitialis]
MKDLGELHHFLAISVSQYAHGLFLSQSKYATDILYRANMSNCNSVITLVDTNKKLRASSRLWPACGRPYTLSQSCGSSSVFDLYTTRYFLCRSTKPHFQALRRILRYLKKTLQFGLQLSPTSSNHRVAYTGADCGIVRTLVGPRSAISSKRQAMVFPYSFEAEYRGVSNVVSKTCWIHNLLLELHCPIIKATFVYCDNVSAIYLLGNPVQHHRTKHVEFDIHFVRNQVARGQVRVLHVPSRFQFADVAFHGYSLRIFDPVFAFDHPSLRLQGHIRMSILGNKYFRLDMDSYQATDEGTIMNESKVVDEGTIVNEDKIMNENDMDEGSEDGEFTLATSDILDEVEVEMRELDDENAYPE